MNYNKYNDYELLNFISENNNDANEILYDKYKPIIISIAKKMINYCPNSGNDLNDLIQEGMIALNFAIETFDDCKETTFYTYAKTCIKRRLVSVIIKSKRLKNKFLNESVSLEQVDDETEIKLENFLGDNSYNPEQILINHELNKEMIEKVRESLTDLEEQVFDLKINDFTYREIAEILEMNPKAVDNATQRIRNKIKEILK